MPEAGVATDTRGRQANGRFATLGWKSLNSCLVSEILFSDLRADEGVVRALVACGGAEDEVGRYRVQIVESKAVLRGCIRLIEAWAIAVEQLRTVVAYPASIQLLLLSECIVKPHGR